MTTELHSARIAATGAWGVLRRSLTDRFGPRGLLGLLLWVGAINGFLYFTVVKLLHRTWVRGR